jgi:hypothetical protein
MKVEIQNFKLDTTEKIMEHPLCRCSANSIGHALLLSHIICIAAYHFRKKNIHCSKYYI